MYFTLIGGGQQNSIHGFFHISVFLSIFFPLVLLSSSPSPQSSTTFPTLIDVTAILFFPLRRCSPIVKSVVHPHRHAHQHISTRPPRCQGQAYCTNILRLYVFLFMYTLDIDLWAPAPSDMPNKSEGEKQLHSRWIDIWLTFTGSAISDAVIFNNFRRDSCAS